MSRKDDWNTDSERELNAERVNKFEQKDKNVQMSMTVHTFYWVNDSLPNKNTLLVKIMMFLTAVINLYLSEISHFYDFVRL